MIQTSEIYVSTDVEMDGPVPGKHSMLSLGAAAFLADKRMLDTFNVNVDVLPDAVEDPDTMQWWKTEPTAWKACRLDPQSPVQAMKAFGQWVDQLPGTPVFVAYPAGNDFLFVQWYFHTFIGHSPFGHNALDMRSYAMAVLKQPFYQSGKQQMPRSWLNTHKHTHIALDDAIGQGQLFCNMLNSNLGTTHGTDADR